MLAGAGRNDVPCRGCQAAGQRYLFIGVMELPSASAEAQPAVRVQVLLDARLIKGRGKLGKKVQGEKPNYKTEIRIGDPWKGSFPFTAFCRPPTRRRAVQRQPRDTSQGGRGRQPGSAAHPDRGPHQRAGRPGVADHHVAGGQAGGRCLAAPRAREQCIQKALKQRQKPGETFALCRCVQVTDAAGALQDPQHMLVGFTVRAELRCAPLWRIECSPACVVLHIAIRAVVSPLNPLAACSPRSLWLPLTRTA